MNSKIYKEVDDVYLDPDEQAEKRREELMALSHEELVELALELGEELGEAEYRAEEGDVIINELEHMVSHPVDWPELLHRVNPHRHPL